jgi:hypothetical protein
LSRTPSIETTARLLTSVWDRHADRDLLADTDAAGVDGLAVAPHVDLGSAGDAAGTLIFDPVGDGLRLSDDAEARRGDQHDTAVAFVLVAGDQRMHRRGEAERRHLVRHIVHAAVGDHDGAGDAVVRHVRESG